MQPGRCPCHPDAALRPVVRDAPDTFWGCPGAFSYGRCPECGSWVLDPRPAPDEMGPFYAHYYSDDELAAARKAFADKPAKAALGLDGLRAQVVAKQLQHLGLALKGARLLDVGCGLGGFARALRDQAGVEARGVDFNPTCRAVAAELHGLTVDVGELAAQGYAEGSFDLITSWHCLEHTYDPGAELREMARAVRPGGLVMVEVPTPTFWARLFRGRWFFLQAPTHLYHLRPATLRALVEGAGLSVVQLSRPYVPTELAGSVLAALGLRGFAPRLLFGPRTLADHLWRMLFWTLLPLDFALTAGQALFGGAGVLRVFARRPLRDDAGSG
ncbi:MAG: class I SAM-dependent methyltransferase [Myxococcales bacterium]|nr:class I SAM-dependent methyltransferase [Myxococcales bacterium]